MYPICDPVYMPSMESRRMSPVLLATSLADSRCDVTDHHVAKPIASRVAFDLNQTFEFFEFFDLNQGNEIQIIREFFELFELFEI